VCQKPPFLHKLLKNDAARKNARPSRLYVVVFLRGNRPSLKRIFENPFSRTGSNLLMFNFSVFQTVEDGFEMRSAWREFRH
jgi:hypothetical protein